MKKHLIEISKILKNFKKKYDFIEAYLKIQGTVQKRSHSSLTITCSSEFNEFTIKEVEKIKKDLYEEIRLYLDINNIDQTLYITTEYRGWAASNILIYFREEFKF